MKSIKRRTQKTRLRRKRSVKRRQYKRKSVYKRRYIKRRSYKRKRYRRKRRVNPSACQLKIEIGGTQTSGNATGTNPPASIGQMVYVGHGTSIHYVHQVMVYSILKKLMSLAGIYYGSLEDSFIDENVASPFYQLRLQWQFGEEGELQVTTFDISAADSLATVGNGLYTNFRASYLAQVTAGGKVNLPAPIWRGIQVNAGTATGSRGEYRIAYMKLDTAKLTFIYNSKMKMQNKTAAEGGVLAQTDLNNVNPLSARIYRGYYNRNYIAAKNWGSTVPNAKYRGWIPDYKGFIVDNDAQHQFTNFRELPGKKDVSCHSMNDFNLHPGQVVIDKIGCKKTISLRKFLELARDTYSTDVLTTTNTGAFVAALIGKANVFGYDKLVFDRSSIAVDTTKVSIGWEIDASYTCMISIYNQPTIPFVDIDNAAWSR